MKILPLLFLILMPLQFSVPALGAVPAACVPLLLDPPQNHFNSVDSLLDDYKSQIQRSAFSSRKLIFAGVETKDVYNPSKSFLLGGKLVFVARVESRDSETDSLVAFFEEDEGKWKPILGAPTFKMQDPFVTFVNGDLVLGGVQTFPEASGGIGYKTVFYSAIGNVLATLRPVAEGPGGMKDIRLKQLTDGTIFVLTRPQNMNPITGVDAGRGKIGYMLISSLSELTPEAILKARLIEGIFENSEWGGGNDILILKNGKLGVLGHIAKFDTSGNRHYYSIVFTIDLATGKVTPPKIIAERSMLEKGLDGESKRGDLRNVLFSGGIARNSDGTATINVGAGDAEAHMITVTDPFLEYER